MGFNSRMDKQREGHHTVERHPARRMNELSLRSSMDQLHLLKLSKENLLLLIEDSKYYVVPFAYRVQN